MRRVLGIASLALVLCACDENIEVSVSLDDEPTFEIEHGYAVNDGVKLHYATAGEGPLVVMIHGFPDYWYTWREQMEGLYDEFQVVAFDTRGYNRSDAPAEESAYAMSNLIADVEAVINHFGQESATVVGHDWGGVIAWQTAFNRPDLVDQLIILNLPHPNGWIQSWEDDPEIKATTDYARVLATGEPDQPDIFFGNPMTPQTLSGWVRDPEARALYVEAFERSHFEGMLSYYRQNYPRNWEEGYQPPPPVPSIEISTLMFHGLEDIALHSDGLNNNWDYIDADLTLVTIPGASHFVQQDASELVTATMRSWLLARVGAE